VEDPNLDPPSASKYYSEIALHLPSAKFGGKGTGGEESVGEEMGNEIPGSAPGLVTEVLADPSPWVDVCAHQRMVRSNVGGRGARCIISQ